MSVLITGGAGFIGSHTCVALLNAGLDIVVADNFYNSSPDSLQKIKEITGRDFPFYEIDICDKAALASIFDAHKIIGSEIEAVVHFAAYKAVGESVEKPLMYYNNNLMSTITLCEVMKDNGCKKLVYSSSATVYGHPDDTVPFTEDMPTMAINPYGQTKLMSEQLLSDMSAADPSLSVILLRYFNPIGAHPSGLIGENPNGIPNNIFPYITKVAAGELPCVNIFGNDYDTPDGTGVRDYIHVCDLARGHLLALEYCDKSTGCRAINLGTGRGTSVLELLSAFSAACGKEIPHAVTNRRPGDLATVYAGCSLAKELLGFEAEYSVDDMCRDGWNYISEQKRELAK